LGEEEIRDEGAVYTEMKNRPCRRRTCRAIDVLSFCSPITTSLAYMKIPRMVAV
jgi:hypothetical protein